MQQLTAQESLNAQNLANLIVAHTDWPLLCRAIKQRSVLPPGTFPPDNTSALIQLGFREAELSFVHIIEQIAEGIDPDEAKNDDRRDRDSLPFPATTGRY